MHDSEKGITGGGKKSSSTITYVKQVQTDIYTHPHMDVKVASQLSEMFNEGSRPPRF